MSLQVQFLNVITGYDRVYSMLPGWSLVTSLRSWCMFARACVLTAPRTRTMAKGPRWGQRIGRAAEVASRSRVSPFAPVPIISLPPIKAKRGGARNHARYRHSPTTPAPRNSRTSSTTWPTLNQIFPWRFGRLKSKPRSTRGECPMLKTVTSLGGSSSWLRRVRHRARRCAAGPPPPFVCENRWW
jgi:hypothetical protein